MTITAKNRYMTIHPKEPIDLLLAPVAAQIDKNLQVLRERSPDEVEAALELALDRPEWATHTSREDRVLKAALQNVDMHGWRAVITPDHTALRLTGGSVSLDLALGASVQAHLSGD
jgi:hypothetical protein